MSDSKHTIYGSQVEREIEHLRQQRDQLLAALKAIVSNSMFEQRFDHCGFMNATALSDRDLFRKLWAKARDAIEKAEGRSMTTGSHSEPCINWPCAKGAGHAGPCGTSQPPSRIGPTEPDDTMVICPVCTSQFRAIPLDVQRVRDEIEHLRQQRDELLAIAKRYAAECRLCGGHGVRRRPDLDDGTPLDDVSCEQCADVRLVIARAECAGGVAL